MYVQSDNGIANGDIQYFMCSNFNHKILSVILVCTAEDEYVATKLLKLDNVKL